LYHFLSSLAEWKIRIAPVPNPRKALAVAMLHQVIAL
jgi:hypothetical protein